jgi:hypothetical protein
LATFSTEDFGFIVAVATANGRMFVRHNRPEEWDPEGKKLLECGHKPIVDVKFSNNGHMIAAASTDKYIYLF